MTKEEVKYKHLEYVRAVLSDIFDDEDFNKIEISIKEVGESKRINFSVPSYLLGKYELTADKFSELTTDICEELLEQLKENQKVSYKEVQF